VLKMRIQKGSKVSFMSGPWKKSRKSSERIGPNFSVDITTNWVYFFSDDRCTLVYDELGHFIKSLEGEELEVGLMQDVTEGSAIIRSDVVGGVVTDYTINIESISRFGTGVDKGMVIRVTDDRLIDATGGIIQGMSGSPIIQNGKLIGAVTHVFVNDAKKGYGIFIENMIK